MLAPWLIEVRLDGAVVYRCRNERFAFADNNQLRLERCDVVDGDGAAASWTSTGSSGGRQVDVPGREGGLWYLGTGRRRAWPPGNHELEIVAEDRAGGRAR